MSSLHQAAVVLSVAIAISNPLAAQIERAQSRSMTVSRNGIVATSRTLASAAGAKVLKRGGSAADAAIAANAVISVVEPMMGGVGGDLFVLYWEAKTKKIYGLNASGWAPKALTIDFVKSKGITNLGTAGIHSSPVDGWAKLHKQFGRLPWEEIFKPAIYYARNGYPVTERIHDYWWHRTTHLMTNKTGSAIFLHNGLAPAIGEMFRNPSLADTLALIAHDGSDAFYRGPIAKSILQTSDRLGGTMAAADLAEYQAEWVTPISTTYRGWTVYEMPPNSQGVAALSMLNILETFPLASMGPASAETLHTQIEAHKLAAQDLNRYVGDPRAVKVPVKALLDKAYAAQRSALIDPQRANCDPKPGEPQSGDTMYLTVVDRDGNIASLIQSLSRTFGDFHGSVTVTSVTSNSTPTISSTTGMACRSPSTGSQPGAAGSTDRFTFHANSTGTRASCSFSIRRRIGGSGCLLPEDSSPCRRNSSAGATSHKPWTRPAG